MDGVAERGRPPTVSDERSAVLAIRLEQLADVARAELAESRAAGSVHDPSSPEARAAVTALQAAIVDAGYSPQHAAWAMTKWIITRRPVMECIATTDETGPSDL